MTTTATTSATSQGKIVAFHGAAQKALQENFPPRSAPDAWTVTAEARDQVIARLRELSADSSKHTRYHRVRGAELILSWLETFPGVTWQQRWRNSSYADTPHGTGATSPSPGTPATASTLCPSSPRAPFT